MFIRKRFYKKYFAKTNAVLVDYLFLGDFRGFREGVCFLENKKPALRTLHKRDVRAELARL